MEKLGGDPVIASVYDKKFFDKQVNEALDSARLVVPVVLRFVRPQSVVDIGCGRGAWLKAFKEAGVEKTRGFDGAYIDPSTLLIEASEFEAVDLTRPFSVGRRYDLVVCLEVGEHLPGKVAPSLVKVLTEAAPVALFSAAIPGQTGTNHINEQWPDYWEALFNRCGFERLDSIRPLVWQDSRIAFYYRQNLFLYVAHDVLNSSDLLRQEAERTRNHELELVHKDNLSRLTYLPDVLKRIPGAVFRSVRRRLVPRD